MGEEFEELVSRLRGLRKNYAHRAEHLPHPPLTWADAVQDIDDVLCALEGKSWAERRGLAGTSDLSDAGGRVEP